MLQKTPTLLKAADHTCMRPAAVKTSAGVDTLLLMPTYPSSLVRAAQVL
jgi:hypothetical protein